MTPNAVLQFIEPFITVNAVLGCFYEPPFGE